jgi:hypothetical protein
VSPRRARLKDGRMVGSGMTAWLRERRLLLVLAVGLPLGEMGVLAAFGLRSGMGLAGQVTAPGPFGVFHDLRLLFVFHDSILGFVLGAAALVAGRSLLGALLVRSAWPGKPPPFGLLLRHALVITLVAAVFLSPWVTLMFGAAVIPLSWIYFAALPPALAIICCSTTAAWTAAGGAGCRRRARQPGWGFRSWR